MRQTNSVERTRRTIRSSKKVFITCEGYVTENNYFNELSAKKDVLGMDPSIEMVVLNRFEDEDGLSDPLNVARISNEFLGWARDGKMTPHLLSGMVTRRLPVCKDELAAIRCEICDSLKGVTGTDGNVEDMEQAMAIAEEILEGHGCGGSLLPLPEFDFRQDDAMCIVVDRDYSRSRNDGRYRMFLDYCNGHGLDPYVTNPKFELWVLMHLENTQDCLDGIIRSSNPSKAVDIELGRRMADYRKNIPFDRIILGLDTAMGNSSMMPEDSRELQSRVGTGLPRLIRMLRGQEKDDRQQDP